MTKFEAGRTYQTRSICDHNCIFGLTVAKRTEKTITTADGKRLRIFVHNDTECVMPLGRYSMAPTISANKAV